MPSKKAQRVKTAKPGTRGKKIGLTSAIGTKATTAVVIIVAAAGLWFGMHQRLAPTVKAATPSADTDPVMMADPAGPGAKTGAAPKPHDTNVSAATTGSEMESPSQSPRVPATTLEGCLEQSGDTYRLKNTSGSDAPKARSWKSGFLKKTPATIEVVDGSHSLGLANRVGTRVSVTGTLVDREMQAHTIHRVASSCNQ